MNAFKTRRKALKIKRQDLATAAGVSVSTLWRIEERKTPGHARTLHAIEQALAIKESETKTEAAS
jgi:transcriptional regulator with XRE-family HTH domain